MANTILLPVGYPYTLVKDVIYALPARRVLLMSETTGITLFQSNAVAFSASVAVTLANGQAELAGGFLKATSNSPGPITLKAMA